MFQTSYFILNTFYPDYYFIISSIFHNNGFLVNLNLMNFKQVSVSKTLVLLFDVSYLFSDI